jgi:integrase
MSNKLKNSQVLAAKAATKDYKLFDGEGMYLLVTTKGYKYWRLKYTYCSKERLLAMGKYPDISLKEARYRRAEARKLLSNGFDPVAERQATANQVARKGKNSFERVCKEWHEMQRHRWQNTHAMNVWNRLEKDAIPSLGNISVSKITAPDILKVIRQIEARNATYLSKRTLQTISAVFRYSVACGYCKTNPAAELYDALKPHVSNSYPTISREEVPDFYRRLSKVDTHDINKAAIKLLMLTFLRQGELRTLKWEYIDFDRSLILIPHQQMKMKKAHVVPIAVQTWNLLKELQYTTGYSKYLFPSHMWRVSHISKSLINKIFKRMGYDGKFVGHGVRALASTVLNGQGFQPEVVERQLAHKLSGTRGIYNRAEYLIERGEMMTWWACFLEECEKKGTAPTADIINHDFTKK